MKRVWHQILYGIVNVLFIAVFVSGCAAETYSPPATSLVTGGIHEDLSSPAEGMFLATGETDYRLVLPADAQELEIVAAEELTEIFAEATGIELERVTDSGLTFSPSLKYLSIGETTLLKQAGIELDAEKLAGDGFIIKTVGESIFLSGASQYGTLYSVYEFLNRILHYDFYFTNAYRLDREVENIPLMNYDITEVPDIANRAAGYGFISEDMYSLYRMRQRPYTEYFIPIGDIIFHNSLEYIEGKEEGHPLWRSTDGTQLCYNAQGNSEERTALLEACKQTLIEALVEYPDRNLVTMTIQDNNNFCTCSACLGIRETYGADSASVILFCNDLSEAIRQWFQTTEGAPFQRDLEILFFAYNKTVEAPVSYDEKTGEYTGNNGIKCGEGVSVFYAPIGADFTRGLTAPENESTRNIMKGWAAISESLYLWTYSTLFKDYMIPYDTFNSMQDIYQFAFSVGTEYLFDQAQHDSSGASSGWSVLKAYLNAKLAWNVNADIATLTDEFFQYYFEEASDAMREWFDGYRMHSEYLKAEKGFGGIMSTYLEAKDEAFWSKGVLLHWLECSDRAIKSIEFLKETEYARWQRLYDRICNERLSLYYLLSELYSFNTSAEDLRLYQETFREDATRLGYSRLSEGVPISSFWS